MLLGGLGVSLLWRILFAPMLLGDFDPTDMPGHQRALLALGLLATALIAAGGLVQLARGLRSTDAGPAAAGASVAAVTGVALLATNILTLFAGMDFIGLFWAFGVVTAAAWIVTSVALVRSGLLKWSGMATATLSALVIIGLVTGATIIFIMFFATLPLAIGLARWQAVSAAPLSATTQQLS